jgi:two-component system, OmpR family, response regulator
VAELLVVDDDGHIREVLRFALEQAGHSVAEARDGAIAWAEIERREFDLIVLDVTMPEMDGLELCRRIRTRSTVPIIFVSSRDEELDRILGLELGADDYITKPFSPRELVARVKAALRRYEEIRRLQRQTTVAQVSTKVMEHRGLRLDPERHECTYLGQSITLTATEFGLLAVLLRHPGRVYSRTALVGDAWGSEHHISERTVDSHIRRVRQKLELAGTKLVETVYGVGYRVSDE